MAWSHCQACLVLAVDMVGSRSGGPMQSLVSFVIAEQEIARWLIASIDAREPWQQADAIGDPGFGGIELVADWDRRCPGCRALIRDTTFLDELPGVGGCSTCLRVTCAVFLGRDEAFDLVPMVGFRRRPGDEGDDDLNVWVDAIASPWPGLCPACDAPFPDPRDSPIRLDDGTPVAACDDCWLRVIVEPGGGADGGDMFSLFTELHLEQLDQVSAPS